MKSLVFFLSLTLAPLAAHAAGGYSCNNLTSPDSGLMLKVADGEQSAELSEESIAGPRKVAELQCEHLAIPHIVGPGIKVWFLQCSGDGYVAELSSDTTSGSVVAQVSRGRATQNLPCKAER